MAFCSHCGNEVSAAAAMCPNCGHPQRPNAVAVARVGQQRMDGFAIASLVCSISGFVIAFLIGHILGVVFGKMALERIRQDPSLDGEGLARAGIIIGWVGIGLAAAFVLIFLLFFGAVSSIG